LSYRISQKKFLVVAQNAWIYHAQSSSQRMDRKSNSALVLANSIAMYLMNIQKQGWSSSLTIYRFILKRLVLEVLRDLSKRRLDMPCAKGAFFTLKLVPKLLQLPVPELKRLYPNIQASIFALR
ncbi:MAG: hypothetical protein NTX25_16335, partial [Proteobacteria bacterium]|nr:hypothetical protein [Pseudomonadota bacterium]